LDKSAYNSIENIPARVFFEIRDTGNYQLLRAKNGVKTETLKKVFEQIYDDYFKKSDNREAGEYLDLNIRLSMLEYKKATMMQSLSIIARFPVEIWATVQGREIWKSQCEALSRFLYKPINADSENSLEEFERVLNEEIGVVENAITEVTMMLESMSKNASTIKDFDFYDSLQTINEWNAPQTTPSSCVLAEYVAAEKAANKKAERERLRQMKNG